MYDALTAHRWRNWDGEYCCLDGDDWDWMINAGKDPGITTGDHQQYHIDRLKNLQRRVWAQKGSKAYTPEQVAADPYGDAANKPGREPHHKGGYHRWTQADIDKLGTMPDAMIAERMGLRVQTIRMKRRDMKIARFMEGETK